MLHQLCRRLLDQGIPLHRVAVFVRTLHPNVAGRGFIWHQPSNVVEIVSAPVGIQDTDQYLKSPLRIVFMQHVEVRRELVIATPLLRKQILRMQSEGSADADHAARRFHGVVRANVGRIPLFGRASSAPKRVRGPGRCARLADPPKSVVAPIWSPGYDAAGRP